MELNNIADYKTIFEYASQALPYVVGTALVASIVNLGLVINLYNKDISKQYDKLIGECEAREYTNPFLQLYKIRRMHEQLGSKKKKAVLKEYQQDLESRMLRAYQEKYVKTG